MAATPRRKQQKQRQKQQQEQDQKQFRSKKARAEREKQYKFLRQSKCAGPGLNNKIPVCKRCFEQHVRCPGPEMLADGNNELWDYGGGCQRCKDARGGVECDFLAPRRRLAQYRFAEMTEEEKANHVHGLDAPAVAAQQSEAVPETSSVQSQSGSKFPSTSQVGNWIGAQAGQALSQHETHIDPIFNPFTATESSRPSVQASTDMHASAAGSSFHNQSLLANQSFTDQVVGPQHYLPSSSLDEADLTALQHHDNFAIRSDFDTYTGRSAYPDDLFDPQGDISAPAFASAYTQFAVDQDQQPEASQDQQSQHWRGEDHNCTT